MFAERIRFLRQSKGLNQVELAEKLGISKQSVSNWENENIAPSIDMLVKIADFFGVSTDYLLGRDGIKEGGIESIDATGLTPAQINHVRLIVDDLRSKRD